jgi:hypothetical protein
MESQSANNLSTVTSWRSLICTNANDVLSAMYEGKDCILNHKIRISQLPKFSFLHGLSVPLYLLQWNTAWQKTSRASESKKKLSLLIVRRIKWGKLNSRKMCFIKWPRLNAFILNHLSHPKDFSLKILLNKKKSKPFIARFSQSTYKVIVEKPVSQLALYQVKCHYHCCRSNTIILHTKTQFSNTSKLLFPIESFLFPFWCWEPNPGPQANALPMNLYP